MFEIQMEWLQLKLKESTAKFKFVVFHQPPACTAKYDVPQIGMDLPYREWGATAGWYFLLSPLHVL
jgi:hypothetical protein